MTTVLALALAVDRCPDCGAETEPRRTVDGRTHPSCCLPCTEESIGCTYIELRDRVNEVMAKGVKKKWRVTT